MQRNYFILICFCYSSVLFSMQKGSPPHSAKKFEIPRLQLEHVKKTIEKTEEIETSSENILSTPENVLRTFKVVSSIYDLVFSLKSTYFLTVSDGSIQLYSLENKKLLREIKDKRIKPHTYGGFLDTKTLLFSPEIGQVFTLNICTEKISLLSKKHYISRFDAINPKKKLIGYTFVGNEIKIYSALTDTLSCIKTKGFGHLIESSISFSPKGLFVAAGSYEGKIGIWNIPAGKLVRKFNHSKQAIQRIQFLADGESVLVFSGSSTFVVHEIRWRSKKIKNFPFKISKMPREPYVSSENSHIIFYDKQYERIIIWDLNTGEWHSIPGKNKKVDCSFYSISPQGKFIALKKEDEFKVCKYTRKPDSWLTAGKRIIKKLTPRGRKKGSN